MGYVIGYSRMRRVIALLLMAAAAMALGLPFYAHLQAWSATRFGALPGAFIVTLIAVSTAVVLALAAWHRWCYERDRLVCGIRLMGGPCALLYFSAPLSRALQSPAAPFPYDGHPAMAVTVTRVVHWPGCMISLTFDAAHRADAALDRLSGQWTTPRRTPRVRRMPLWPPGRAITVPMSAPRHLMIFADAMPASQFRSLAISLACLQRGVTFVEHR